MAEELEEAEFWLPSGFLADESRAGGEGSCSGDWADGSDLGSSVGDEITDEEESQSLASLSLNFSRSFLHDREMFPPLSSVRSKEASAARSPDSTLCNVWSSGNSSLASSPFSCSLEKPRDLVSAMATKPSSFPKSSATTGYYVNPSLLSKPHFNQRKTGKANHRDTGSSGMRAVFLCNQPERENAGTGVFLPRTKGAASELRKKPACSTVLLPARVVRALNLDLNEISANSRLPSVYVIGGNGAQKADPRKRSPQPPPTRSELHSDVGLPPEWTY